MTEAEFLAFLGCEEQSDGTIRVKSREKTGLEFKQICDHNTMAKCLKTIAAFANCGGGRIVFGVADRPRRQLEGNSDFADEAAWQDLLLSHLYPVPEIEIIEYELFGIALQSLNVKPVSMPPVVAIRDKQTKGAKNQTVLSQGTVYFRRAGQTRPATGEECASMLERRDNYVRGGILNLISRASEIGFENVAVADFRKYDRASENVTLWVPEDAAKSLNIIDRAKLVEDNGAPAYQIRGSVKLTMPSDKDPRKPMLPRPAARALKLKLAEIFWADFPWGENHLRKVAVHLGFWKTEQGDQKHTGFEALSSRSIYYEDGRKAVLRFATSSPEEFVEVVGSKETKRNYKAKLASA